MSDAIPWATFVDWVQDGPLHVAKHDRFELRAGEGDSAPAWHNPPTAPGPWGEIRYNGKIIARPTYQGTVPTDGLASIQRAAVKVAMCHGLVPPRTNYAATAVINAFRSAQADIDARRIVLERALAKGTLDDAVAIAVREQIKQLPPFIRAVDVFPDDAQASPAPAKD